MVKASRPIFLTMFGARGENILDVVRRLGLGGAGPDSTDSAALLAYSNYIVDNFPGTDLAEVLAAAAMVTGSALYYAPVDGQANAPTGTEPDGTRYIVGTAPTGAFALKGGYIAELVAGTWVFAPPRADLELNEVDTKARMFYTGAAWTRKNAVLDVGEFGAVGDGDAGSPTDDGPAIQAALDWCLNKGIKRLHGDLSYASAQTLDLINYGRGFRFSMGGLNAHPDFPPPATWKTGSSLLRFGNVGGAQVGLDIDIQFLDGKNLADGMSFPNLALGGSRFYISRAENCGIVWAARGDNTWPASSNICRGDYWQNNKMGIYVKSGTAPREGSTFDVSFITGCIYGGCWLGDGSQYAQLRGQFDFNGQYLSELRVPSRTNFAEGDIITGATSHTVGEVLAAYTYRGQQFLLVIEDHNVMNDGSHFDAAETITNTGTGNTTITAIRIPNQAANSRYFDVIQNHQTAPFAKNIFSMAYLGGMVGNLLFTNNMQWANSADGHTNEFAGFQFTNTGNGQCDMINDWDGSTILDINATVVAPSGGRDLYMGAGGGISTGNVGVTLLQSVTTTVYPLSNVSVHGSTYILSCRKPGDVSASGVAIISIDNNGGAVIDQIVTRNITLSLSGLNVQATQGAQTSMDVVTDVVMVTLKN